MDQNKIIVYNTGQLQKLNNVLAVTNKILGIDFRILHIVYLDDHRIFRKGVKRCLKKQLPNIFFEEFTYNTPALYYVEECFKNKVKIDLIITDYNHPGPNGLLFAQEVRKMQNYYFTIVPIMLLTMRMGDDLLEKAVEDGIFEVYFPKSVQPEDLSNFIKSNTSD